MGGFGGQVRGFGGAPPVDGAGTLALGWLAGRWRGRFEAVVNHGKDW